MKYKTQQVILQGKHGSEVVGWVRPRLSEGEEAAIRERLIQRRFEHVDEYLARIDELLRELTQLGALDANMVDAIREAHEAVMKLHPMMLGSRTS